MAGDLKEKYETFSCRMDKDQIEEVDKLAEDISHKVNSQMANNRTLCTKKEVYYEALVAGFRELSAMSAKAITKLLTNETKEIRKKERREKMEEGFYFTQKEIDLIQNVFEDYVQMGEENMKMNRPLTKVLNKIKTYRVPTKGE